MIRTEYLDISKITTDKKILKFFKIIENHGGILRFVGGCVRDAIIGISGSDIDLATDLSPDELVEACKEEGIKTVPIGIKYGTVGVLIGENLLEVTSLRKDIKTDGRHAIVEFTDNWEVDASRRDLTINAVYADDKGNVFDYYNGIEDLENGIVKFIGEPEKRIQEDHLRILRFFRFYSYFSKGEMDRKSFDACIKNKDLLKKISEERIQKELGKILVSPKSIETSKIMFDNDILSFYLPLPKYWKALDFLNNWFNDRNLGRSIIRRFLLIYNPDKELAEHLANMQKLSNKIRNYMVNFAKAEISLENLLDENELKKAIYLHGKEICIDKLISLSCWAEIKTPDIEQKIEKIQNMEIPVMPISGKEIVELGIEGSKIGETIDKLEEQWLISNFKLNADELIKLAKLI